MSTITTINSSDAVSDSRSVINTNFANLNADKVETLSDLGITATSTELNYCDGVTSNIQTQLNTKSAHITGEIKWVAFGEGSIPAGWLICNGAAVSRTTYAALFTAIGTTFGVGNGTTTFNVPDLRGRVIAGKDDMGGSAANVITDSDADTLGGTHGTETHTLTVAELPAHAHSVQRASSTGGGNTVFAESAVITNGNVSTTVSGPINNTGSGTGHNNVQPTIFLNAIIKT